MVVLSSVTVLWLLLQGIVVWRQTDIAYPVTAYGMFSNTKGVAVDLWLEGWTPQGETVMVTPEALGLSALQLRGWIVAELSSLDGEVREDAEAQLAALAALWERQHGQALDGLHLGRDMRHRDAPAVVAETGIVVTWARP